MPKMKYDLFGLESIKITDKEVLVSYYNLDDLNTEENPETANRPHPKLVAALQDLRETMAKALGNLEGWDYARLVAAEAKYVEPGGHLEKAVLGYNNRVHDHNVSGIKIISGKTKGVQITGSVKSDLGTVGQATRPVYFDKVDYGPNAEQLVEKVRVRVFAFLFQNEFLPPEEKPKKGKKKEETDPAQTSILDADQQNGENATPK